jgi:hypothetical protein
LCRSSAQGNFSRRGSGDQSATTWSESTVWYWSQEFEGALVLWSLLSTSSLVFVCVEIDLNKMIHPCLAGFYK